MMNFLKSIPARLGVYSKTSKLVSAHHLESPPERDWDFQPYYDEHIASFLYDYEQDRIKALQKFNFRYAIAVAPCALMVAAILILLFYPSWHQLSGDTVESGVKVLGLALFGIGYWVYHPKFKYKQSVKHEIYPIIFRFFGPDYIFSKSGLLNATTLKPSGIIPSYTSEEIEDYVRGEHEGVSLELTESKLEKGSGKHRHTVFRGILVRLSMHKAFSGHTVLMRDSRWNRLVKSGAIKKLERAELEDPEFESRFDVFTNDQIEARYLLTTSFMDRLLRLEEVMESSGLQASFYQNHLLLMIPSRLDRFEGVNVNEPVTFYSDINVILREMSEIFGIIEHLKLHENTGL